MINFIFRLLLSFNSTSLLIIIYLVKEKKVFISIFPGLEFLSYVPSFLCYLAYILIPVMLTGVSIYLSSYLGQDEFRKGTTSSIEHANNSFLPSYLGYFFVALSINDPVTLGFVYLVLFVFTFLSQALYFNPLFLLYGFEFYNITTQNGASVFLISRSKYKTPREVDIERAFRINNYTFIEKERYELYNSKNKHKRKKEVV
ncbi:hypothetical protein [Cobetia amphilecti]|uniref:Uncharacterized protein n=1 Tax=Cobetia amphilecti TaxID=1055104 RepID=A0AAP4X1D9_9GAMM|nr:hypothetical protein [Cobetia amphilecti]MDO6672831.1 hypothetical protein [Cobetia amphilecti]